jgi:hypothetical protein
LNISCNMNMYIIWKHVSCWPISSVCFVLVKQNHVDLQKNSARLPGSTGLIALGR